MILELLFLGCPGKLAERFGKEVERDRTRIEYALFLKLASLEDEELLENLKKDADIDTIIKTFR